MNYSVPSYFAFFLPLTVLAYQLTPQRHRWKMLLLASYYFFWNISKKLLIYLLVSTVSIHYFGLWMDCVMADQKAAAKGLPRPERKAVKAQYQSKLFGIAFLGVGAQLAVLLVLKYSPFFLTNFNGLLKLVHLSYHVNVPHFVQPIGLSFYTMQAMSYLFDVYRGTLKADRSLPRLALYMSFFPIIMEGPICRYTDTAQQLWEGRGVTWHNLTFGMQRIVYGMFKKRVVADRLDLLVKSVFKGYAAMDGGTVALGVLCYTCELYMEFSGVMDMVIGAAQIFGVTLPENFQQPFFSRSISEFWRRWHITLGAWFRDYLFYPISLTEPMKQLAKNGRQKLGNHFGPLLASAVALFCVWFCNGLWHGAGWSYLFFGMFHFVMILTEKAIEPFAPGALERLHINGEGKGWHAVQLVRTFILINIGELFFRAKTLSAGLAMFRVIVTRFTLRNLFAGSFLNLGLDVGDITVCILSCALVLWVGILRERGISVREKVAELRTVPRWAVYYALFLAIVIFGAYGMHYVPVDPIYAKF